MWKTSIGTDLNRQAALIGKPQQSYARVSYLPISIQNWVYIFPSVEFSIHYSDVLYSEKCQMKNFSLLKCLLFSKTSRPSLSKPYEFFLVRVNRCPLISKAYEFFSVAKLKRELF